MTRLPRITGREVIAGLRKAGFEVARIKGSHHFLRHTHGRGTVVPVHAAEIIGPALVKTDEGYSVSAPGLPGCWSQDSTEEEAIRNIQDAIQEYLAARDELRL